MSAYDDAEAFFDELASWRSSDAADLFFEDLIGKPRWRGRLSQREDAALESAPAPVAPISVPSGFRMGVWLDVGGRSLVSQGARHAALLHDLGFADACIMVNKVEASSFGFSATSEAAVRGFASLLAGSGTRLTLTSWLRADKSYIDDLVRLLPPLAIDIGARAIELDVEDTWRSRRPRGFASHTEAAEYFFNALRPAATGLEIAVTCEVDPMPSERMRSVVQGADVVVPQAYSASGPRRSHGVGGPYGPRGVQERAALKVAEAVRASGKPTILGLAAYGRGGWPGVAADAVMRMELEHTLALRATAAIRGVRYWSWKYIAGLDARGGQPSNTYSQAFFRTSVSVPGAAAAWTPAAAPAPSPTAPRPAPASAPSAPPSGPTTAELGAQSGEWVETESAPGSVLPSTTRPPAQGSATRVAGPRPRSAQQRVLQAVRIELSLTRERIEAAKLYDPARDTTALRAVDARGATVDLDVKLQTEARAWLARHRQVHPVLSRALDRLDDSQRVPILAWIFHEYGPPVKEERGEASRLVAAREEETTVAQPPPSAEPNEDSYTQGLRASVRRALDQARARFRELGVEPAGDLGTVPVLVAEATKAQVNALSRLPEVTGLYLHEPEGVLDLSTSITDARAAAAHSAGFRGANVPVAVWEETPKSTADLAVEATFDPSAAAAQSSGNREHAQLVTAIVKNTQSRGPRGFAPDAKVYSANKFSNDALTWAVVAKRCHVVNQSFHRASEETDPGLSADDLIKDYLILHPPFPTIVQAAGNGPATEYVNHKGFNSITVGNHEDGASRMRATSVFKNPSSAHNDRELPDLSANGTSVSAAGLTKSGTSFASPAVAGSAAVIQSVDAALRPWPEGCRAILLASASRNIVGGTWSQAAASATIDGIDGSGALDTGEAVRIARVRARRDGAAAQHGWDVGTLRTDDLQANGTSRFRYQVQVPSSGARRLKAALAWNSKVVTTSDPAVTPPLRVTESKLTVDLDLYLYMGGALVAHSSTFDSSFEIVELDARPGSTYEIRIKRFSGTDWVWFGLAWTVV